MNDDPESAAYDRGRVAERLAGHDKHFASINGQLGKIADEIHDMRLAMQRFADQAVARDATVVTTAAALKDAEDARRDKTEQTWTPRSRFLTVASIVLLTISVLVAVYVAIKH